MKKAKKEKTKVYDTKKSTRLLAVISSVMLIGIVGLVLYNVVVVNDRDSYMRDMENNYQQSFYELIQSVNDIEGKLGKLSVSSGTATQERLLNDVNKLSAVSISHLSHLLQNIDGENRITKFLNQLGDYADYLYKKVLNGEALSDEDIDKMGEIQRMVQKLGAELSSVSDKMGEGYKLINGYSGKDTFLKDIFDGLNETTVEYPQMIYDGPFSDSADKSTAKGLQGSDITVEEAGSAILAIYSGKTVKADFLNETGGVIPVYNFMVDIDGQQGYISVTKRGGRILCINANRLTGEQKLSEEQCIEAAQSFVVLLGFDDMKNVWVSNYDGIIYVNFAYQKDGVICYPDMIKVKVASDNGDILGAETANYFLNHTERNVGEPTVDKAEAASGISKKLVINYVRLALIPIDDKEKFCYEFYCEYDNALYFVYVDALTGKEVNILRVIDSDSGQLLY
ncbi:MAG: germination protein YpeB [Clostridiales bacterium]|jgi:germination protein YpeB|nr:germination protein YpeB [Clostridiales bacterium]